MPDPGPQIAARLAQLLPAGFCVGSADPRVFHPLQPGEETAGMVPRRRAEFSAGRAAARAALAQLPGLDLGYAAIPQGSDRAPVWPAGVAGSITHCDGVCLAAVTIEARGVGLDVEPDQPLNPEVHALVVGPHDSGGDGLRIFCIKEAAFKAQYAISRAMLGPEDLRVAIRYDEFITTFTRDVAPFSRGDQLGGSIITVAGHVLAACWL